MKKLASFALAFALCAACAVPVLADETKATTIKANIPSSYTVVIPAETTIQFNTLETKLEGPLYLSAAQLEPNHYVKISATANALTNDADKSKTIPFTLYEGNDPFTSADFVDKYKNVQLSVHIKQSDWNAAPAGNYKGSVTFTITYGK